MKKFVKIEELKKAEQEKVKGGRIIDKPTPGVVAPIGVIIDPDPTNPILK